MNHITGIYYEMAFELFLLCKFNDRMKCVTFPPLSQSACMCQSQRLSGVVLNCSSPYFFLRHSHHWIWSLLVYLDWLDSKPQVSCCLCLPMTGIAGTHWCRATICDQSKVRMLLRSSFTDCTIWPALKAWCLWSSNHYLNENILCIKTIFKNGW